MDPRPLTPGDTRKGEMQVVLVCGECGQRCEFKPWSRLTKMSVLRLEGGVEGWYVDGGKVLCREHRPDPLPSPQMETWTEYDRRSVEAMADMDRSAF